MRWKFIVSAIYVRGKSVYMGNQSYWNKKFEARGSELMQPESCLVNDMPHFPKSGTALDLACGDGRNAVYLAEHGFKVTAVDFSSSAVERLKHFASKMELDITVLQKNLCEKEAFLAFGEFDLIVINHYRLEPHFYPVAAQHVKPGGVLWVNGFYKIPEDNPDIKQEDIITQTDFQGLTALTCEDCKIYEAGTRKFIRCIWKKLR